MEPFVLFIVCWLLVAIFEEVGAIAAICLILYSCSGEPQQTHQNQQPTQQVVQPTTTPSAPHYELIERPQYGDPVCEDGYNLMVDTKTGNKACILGATYY